MRSLVEAIIEGTPVNDVVDTMLHEVAFPKLYMGKITLIGPISFFEELNIRSFPELEEFISTLGIPTERLFFHPILHQHRMSGLLIDMAMGIRGVKPKTIKKAVKRYRDKVKKLSNDNGVAISFNLQTMTPDGPEDWLYMWSSHSGIREKKAKFSGQL